MAENQKNDLNKIIRVLIVVAVVLACTLAYIWWSKTSLVSDLKEEKKDLTEQLSLLQNDYSSLSSEYEIINSQLDASKEEVSQLIERVKKTDATNRTKIRQYQKELGTLRTIMRNYIVQIDSLNTLNHRLTADAAAARKEAEESKKTNEELNRQVESLSGQVASGSIIRARGIAAFGHNGSDKVTHRSSRVKRVLVTLSLIENSLAPKGPVKVFIRVKDPQGILLTNDIENTFVCEGESLIASASREIDYEGKEVELSVYLNDVPKFVKGVYTIEVYTEKALLGTTELMLR